MEKVIEYAPKPAKGKPWPRTDLTSSQGLRPRLGRAVIAKLQAPLMRGKDVKDEV